MTNETMKREPAALPMDALAEDLFGLNLRGLRSVRALWRRPRRYYEAARTLDWQDEFTPSIRLWLSFFALYSALKFWWIGGNDGMIDAYTAGFAQAGLVPPAGKTMQDISREAVLWVFGIIPFLQIGSMMMLSVIYPFWGERTNVALRQRYFFATIIPSASLMPVFLTAMLFVPGAWLTAYGIGLAIVTLVIDFQTGYRGAFSKVGGVSKLWRAGLLATIIVALNVVTSIAAQIVGIVLTSQKYGGTPLG